MKKIKKQPVPQKSVKTESGAQKNSVRMICLGLAILMVLGTFATGLAALIEGKKPQTVTYPPLVIYNDEYYMVTGEEISALPEGKTEQFTAQSATNQNDLPTENLTANFGKDQVVFSVAEDGTLYYHNTDGSYLKCQAVKDSNSSESKE